MTRSGGDLDEAQFRLVAALDAFGDVALGFEIVGEQQRQVRLVLDDEDARRGGDAGAGRLSARFVHGVPAPVASVS